MEASFEHHQDLTNGRTEVGKGSAKDRQGTKRIAKCDCGIRPSCEASEEDCKEAGNVSGDSKKDCGGTESEMGEGES
jgi:hypothetical protein